MCLNTIKGRKTKEKRKKEERKKERKKGKNKQFNKAEIWKENRRKYEGENREIR